MALPQTAYVAASQDNNLAHGLTSSQWRPSRLPLLHAATLRPLLHQREQDRPYKEPVNISRGRQYANHWERSYGNWLSLIEGLRCSPLDWPCHNLALAIRGTGAMNDGNGAMLTWNANTKPDSCVLSLGLNGDWTVLACLLHKQVSWALRDRFCILRCFE